MLASALTALGSDLAVVASSSSQARLADERGATSSLADERGATLGLASMLKREAALVRDGERDGAVSDGERDGTLERDGPAERARLPLGEEAAATAAQLAWVSFRMRMSVETVRACRPTVRRIWRAVCRRRW